MITYFFQSFFYLVKGNKIYSTKLITFIHLSKFNTKSHVLNSY